MRGPVALLLALVLAAPAQASIPIVVDNSSGSATFMLDDSYNCDDSGACDGLAISVRSPHGVVVWHRTGSTLDAGPTLGDGRFAFPWECVLHGRLTWHATETRDGAEIDSADGVIHVPSCNPPKLRYVHRAAAVRYARHLIPKLERVDSVDCGAVRPRSRGTRSAQWACDIVSDSATFNYACIRHALISFWLTPKGSDWGRYERTANWRRYAPDRCG